MARLLLVLTAAALASCRASPDPLEYETAPRDFAVDVTVQGPSREATPRWRRPGRYIVEPDGTLRAGVGEGVSDEYFPPETRVLSRARVERLWRLVRDSALLAEDNPDRVRPGLPFGTVQLRPTAQISITFAGDERHYRVILDGQTPSAESAEALIDHLAALAWIEP